MVVLHALGGTNTSVQTRYGLTNLKDDYRDVSDGATNRGAFVIALSAQNIALPGPGPAWDASPDSCCNNSGTPNDDQGYVTRVIAEARAHLPIDPTRIFLIGESNGNFLADRVACHAPSSITGVIGFCGAGQTPTDLANLGACVASPLTSEFHLHGSGDNTVAYNGGAPVPGLSPALNNVISAHQTVDNHAALNGCTGSLTTFGTSTWITSHPNTNSTYTTCPAHGEVVLAVNDLGHCTNQTYTAQAEADVIAWMQQHQGTPRPRRSTIRNNRPHGLLRRHRVANDNEARAPHRRAA